MMARKMAGIFALMAFGSYLAAWFWTRRAAGGLGGSGVEEAWQTGVLVAIGYWLTGLFVATLGIGLVQEVLADRGSRDAERRFRAKSRYDQLMSEDGRVASGSGPGS